MNKVCSLQEFCEDNDLQVTQAYKTILGLGITPVGHIEIAGEFEINSLLFVQDTLIAALSEMQHIVEPFYCDYLGEDRQRTRLILQPQRVWFGTLPGTQEQHWLLTALDVQTDEEVTLRLSHINA
jgi:hypothetical protein